MRNRYKGMLGTISLATGVSILLSMVLPHWILTLIIAFILIGCGIFLFMY